MLGIVIAILSGILMSAQGVFNTQVTKQTGLWVSSSFVQFTALLVCLLAWFFSGRSSFAALFDVHPYYLLLGGVMGAFITITVIRATSSLGPAQASMIIVSAQLTASWLIEKLGLFGMEKQPLEWRQVFGLLLGIGGVVLFRS